VSKDTIHSSPARAAVLALLIGFTCKAACAADTPAATPDTGDLHMDIEVIARRLDLARQQIQPSLGATTYSFSPEALQDVPQGANAPLNQVLLLDMRLYLENDILVKLDRASMAASLEGRVPLLNNDFVEYATHLPLNLKLRGLRSKFLLKRALRGILPAGILNRPKKGFGIPVADWFRGPLKEQMLSVLSPERIGREGFFDPGEVKRLIDDHLGGKRDNRKQLWTLFAFEIWHDGYLKG